MATKIVSATAYIDWQEWEGDSLDMNLNWTDKDNVNYDISGYTACLQIKKKATDDPALLELEVGTGITLGDGTTDYNIIVEITQAQNIALGAGKFVYDIELKSPVGKVNTIVSGKYTLQESVSKCQ